MSADTAVLAEGLGFPESPRWHQGQLWCTDHVARQVLTVDATGTVQVRHETEDRPSGIGWRPDGGLLMVAMHGRRVVRIGAEGGEVLATLTTHGTPYACMLGGDDRRTLFVTTSEGRGDDPRHAPRTGRIEVVEVEATGVGLP